MESSFGISGEVEPDIEGYVSGIKELTAADILPSTGVHLGLDLSTAGTGIAVWRNGSLEWDTITLETDKKHQHAESLIRRELREYLEEYFSGQSFDTIIIEDVFIGLQLHGVRWLFALNSVIDDMILDGVISCKVFHRVGNTTWKSWLRTTDPGRSVTGYNDKEVISRLLERLGVPVDVKQDQLDALGMLVGYFARDMNMGSPKALITKTSLRSIRDVRAVYVSTSDALEKSIPGGYRRREFVDRVSERKILEAVTLDPNTVWYTKKQVSLGNITEKLRVDPIPFGGYVAFWSKEISSGSQ